MLRHQKLSRLTSLVQSAYCNQQFGASQNFHQLVENARVIVVGTGLKIFVQYELRIANGLKSQLLVIHRFLPFEGETPLKSRQLIDQVIFLIYPLNFCFKTTASPLMRGSQPGSLARPISGRTPLGAKESPATGAGSDILTLSDFIDANRAVSAMPTLYRASAHRVSMGGGTPVELQHTKRQVQQAR